MNDFAYMPPNFYCSVCGQNLFSKREQFLYADFIRFEHDYVHLQENSCIHAGKRFYWNPQEEILHQKYMWS